MNCNDVRKILDNNRLNEITPDLLITIESHLVDCSDCRKEVSRLTNLRNYIKPSDELGDFPLPMNLMRQKIEARLQHNKSVATSGLKLRYAALIIPVLLIVAYFVFDQKETPAIANSYELSITGIDLDVAENDDRLCDMFYDVGLEMAAVDIVHCDTTCNLVIFDLQSEAEARLAITIIENINDRDISTKIIPVSAI